MCINVPLKAAILKIRACGSLERLMRPAGSSDFLCKIVPKTQFVLLTEPFSYDIGKASIDTWISEWNYYTIDLKNGSIFK